VKRSTLTVVAVAVAALAAAGMTSLNALADEHDPDALLWADYEAGGVTSGNPEIGLGKCCTHSIQTSGTGRDSTTSIRHELRQTDAPVKGGMRSESDALNVDEARFGVGDSRYYAFSVYLPSTWAHDGSAEDIVFQWHNTPSSTESCEPKKTPSAFLAVHPGSDPAPPAEWRLRVNADPNACTTADSIAKTHYSLGTPALGQWTDFVFKFDWAYDASGHIDAWMQTSKSPGWRQVVDADGPNTYNDNHVGGYVKWGLYKPGWNGGATSGVDMRAVLHDNVAVGTTCASVMPTGWGAPPGCDATAAADFGLADTAVTAGQTQPRALARRRRH
jgi:hypothetical protein